MINRKIKIRLLSLVLLSGISLYTYSKEIKGSKQDNKARKIEMKADRKFIGQEFDKAMEIYESAFVNSMSTEYAAALHLKTARLYLTLLDYLSAIPHYEAAMASGEELFTAVDVCNYLDALRYSGQKIKASGIARQYAYRDVYKLDQRYQNILHALNFEDGFLPVGAPEYNVDKVESAGTSNSEFWIGRMQNDFFYATSNSRFHDPNKKFYHRTRYYSLDENSKFSLSNEDNQKDAISNSIPVYLKNGSLGDNQKNDVLHSIPIYLQNGPLSFSHDMSKIIVTEVSYDKGDQISMSKKGINTFQTKLYYSQYDAKRRGWSAFTEAFPQKQGFSYAHPYIFNNDRSVLFSSDIPEGFGGYDIYVAHWDEKNKRWGEPINLGPQVNTEGDEISPCFYEDMLVFSSNGHVGFGGYDLYGISYENNSVVPGSRIHFDYPLNTALNDFGMLRINLNTGYIVSDRQRVNKDDIFYFERNKTDKKNSLIYGMSESKAISNGAISLIGNEGNYNNLRKESLPQFNYTQHMLSVYFDFDSFNLDYAATTDLANWLKKVNLKNIESLVIDGYADEMGTEFYNYNLSNSRAEIVAQWLAEQGVNVKVVVSGKGKVRVGKVDSSEVPFHSDYSSNYNSWSNRIWMNRKARRVDIIGIIK
ncbi:OmpA family protein [Dysgonomonas sp. ZJ709]|uniref:OmpA family protein n=1 Tax=Dysgonomonas sp. ZJ709 TaxID=2709797 RepID=UPI0021080540|nr:OmpA family protein [Dysgonomonas sp. ZJ709]